MRLATFARISAILLLCLALRGCEGRLPFNAAAALAQARAAAIGTVGPDVKVFNVLDYGAKADGKTDSAMNFIRTFKAACNYNGNAMMVIPDRKFFLGPVIFSGPCFNPSPLIIQANGMVTASSDISLYTDQDWITFQNLDGLILTGHGTFHGQGAEVWKKNDCDHNSDCVLLPATMKFVKVNNVIIRGLTSIDPKGFHFFITQCQNFWIFNLRLVAPEDSPNTDGIHMSKSNLVKISKSSIATGDDCVSMIQGSTNISIKKVYCGPGHGFSIGSLGHYDFEQDVSGITVRNCSMTDTDNGLRIKTYKNKNPSKASGIVFRDVTMTRVKNPIIIDQEYGTRDGSASSKVSISNVFYTNIKGTTTSKAAVDLVCSSSNPCKNVHLNNVNLQYEGPPNDHPFTSNCDNVKVAYVGFQSPPPCL